MVFEIKNENDIVNDILINLVTEVDKINDINPGSVIRTLVEALSAEIYEQYTQMQSLYDNTNITTAEDTGLENLGALVGVTRNIGTKASGYVSFGRNSTVTVDFTIPSETIVKTAATSLYSELQFKTKAAKTFTYYVIGETFDFYEGVKGYKLTERKFTSGTGGLINLTGTKGAIAATFVSGTDWDKRSLFQEYIVTDTTTVEVIDNCDATTSWTNASDCIAVAVEGTEKIQGTNSLQLGKTGATQSYLQYSKDLAVAANIEGKVAMLNVWFTNQATIDKFTNFGFILGSNKLITITDVYKTSILKNKLNVGWNSIPLDYMDYESTDTLGDPNPKNIEWVSIFSNMPSAVAIAQGDILIDFIYAAEAEKYTGDIIEFTDYTKYPDDSTAVTFSWWPLTVDIECEAADVGDEYNVSTYAIQYRESSITNIDTIYNYNAFTNGVSIETDDELRARIISTASSPGKATSTALENSLLDIDGISSVYIEDMPEKNIYSEPHIYNAAITDYKLFNEIPYLSSINTIISDTVGPPYPVDYTYTTDYTVNDDGEVVWITTGTNPVDGAIFYVTYLVKKIGFANAVISGTTYPLNTDLYPDILEAINITKPTGISVTWREPTVIMVDISCTIIVNTSSGYDSTVTKFKTTENIVNWMNSNEIGESLKVSEFYSTVMSTPGVTNVTLTNWDGAGSPFTDVSCEDDKVIKDGTISVT